METFNHKSTKDQRTFQEKRRGGSDQIPSFHQNAQSAGFAPDGNSCSQQQICTTSGLVVNEAAGGGRVNAEIVSGQYIATSSKEKLQVYPGEDEIRQKIGVNQ